MIKKNEKPRVGRPKLADDKTKKNQFSYVYLSLL